MNNMNHFTWIILYIKRSSYGVFRLIFPHLVVLICRDIKRCFCQKLYDIEQNILCFYLFDLTMTLKHAVKVTLRFQFSNVPKTVSQFRAVTFSQFFALLSRTRKLVPRWRKLQETRIRNVSKEYTMQ